MKRDSAGTVVKREKRVREPRGRKRIQSVLDEDRGVNLDSGDETDFAEHLGLFGGHFGAFSGESRYRRGRRYVIGGARGRATGGNQCFIGNQDRRS